MGYNPYDSVGKIEISLGLEFTFTERAVLRSFKLPSFWVAVAILGMIPLLSAQESRGVPQGPVSPRSSGLPPGPVTPQIAAAVMCNRSGRPIWCRESDIGAWTNAAIALIGCGEVYIPAGTYRQTTPIVKPRCVKLGGASGYGTTLTYTTTTGCAVVIADNSGSSLYAPGALEDLNFVGPGAGPPADNHPTSTCGVYFGGSDGGATSPTTPIDPATNYGDHGNLNRVRISHFGVGVQFGFNTWRDTIFESVIASNGTGVSMPANITAGNPVSNSGENITLLNSSVLNNVGVGLFVGTGLLVNFNLVNTSFDFNHSWAVQNGTTTSQNAVSFVNGYIVQPNQWIQNYGHMNLDGVYATDGSDSGTLGYLIDNENESFTVTGGEFFNGGSGTTLNSAGVGSVWLGALVTPGLTGPVVGLIDRFGDAGFAALTASSAVVSGAVQGAVLSGNLLSQNTAGQLAGTSACSSGTQTISFGATYASQPVILLFDETTAGGVKLSAKSTSGFTAACAGAADVFDWMVIGNPN